MYPRITRKSGGNVGVMIAAYIKEPFATTLAAMARDAMGEYADLTPIEELHITLAYVGDDYQELEHSQPGLKEKLLRGLEKVTEAYRLALHDEGWCGYINGTLRFFPLDEKAPTPLAFTFDSACMARWRPKIIDALESELANVDQSHGFIPHITFSYVPRTRPMPDIVFDPIWMTISDICLEWGDERYSFCLDGSAPEYNLAPTPVREASPLAETMPVSSFMVYKSVGVRRWLMVSSSSFKDRDGEWVTGKALLDDQERGDLLALIAGKERAYGPLAWWHLTYPYLEVKGDWTSATAGPGIILGWCDFSATHVTEKGVSLVESGTFVSDEVGEAVESHVDELGISLTFAHPIDEPGSSKTFNNIRKVERSLLPARAASNLATFTLTTTAKEARPMDGNKITELENLGVSRKTIDFFLESVATRQKELAAAGVTAKETGAAPTNETEAVAAALDQMGAGILALKEYITKAKAPPVPPQAKGGDSTDDDEGDDDKSMPPKRKEVSIEGLLTAKEVDDRLAAFKVDLLKELGAGIELVATKAAESAVAAALKGSVDQTAIVTKSVQGIEAYLKQLTGELPPALFGSPSSSGDNVIDANNPLHQKEFVEGQGNVAAGQGGQGGQFAQGPFGWLEGKMTETAANQRARVVPQGN